MSQSQSSEPIHKTAIGRSAEASDGSTLTSQVRRVDLAATSSSLLKTTGPAVFIELEYNYWLKHRRIIR
jgi:hypothetical protein